MSTRTLTPTNPFPDPSPSPEPNPNQVRGSAYARRPCSARCRAVSASSLASSRHSRTACALHVHCMCTACALHVHCMCTASVLRVHSPSPSPRRAPQVDPGDGKTSAVNIFAQQPAQHGPHNTAKAGAVAQPPACMRPRAPRQRPTLPLAWGCPLTALSAPETEEADEEAAAALWRLPKVADSTACNRPGPTVAGGWLCASMAKSWLRLGGHSRCHSKLPRPPGTPSFG